MSAMLIDCDECNAPAGEPCRDYCIGLEANKEHTTRAEPDGENMSADLTIKIEVKQADDSWVAEFWTIPQILAEINDDKYMSWNHYMPSNWLEGWNDWVENKGYCRLARKMDGE